MFNRKTRQSGIQYGNNDVHYCILLKSKLTIFQQSYQYLAPRFFNNTKFHKIV